MVAEAVLFSAFPFGLTLMLSATALAQVPAPIINIETDQLIPIVQVPRHVPGNPPHVNSVWRWVNKGVRGRKLAVVHIGGRVYTSKEALREFFQPAASTAPVESDADRTRRAKEAGAALEAIGA